MEDDLQQQVAEFLAQVVEIAAADRVGDFVGFLDRVWCNGGEALLQVPRAARARRAQRRHDVDQGRNVARRLFHGGVLPDQSGRRDARSRAHTEKREAELRWAEPAREGSRACQRLVASPDISQYDMDS